MSVLVEFKNVSFRYRDDMPWVLRNCSFKIYHNEWVAIIGQNGSGKSTVSKLMNGLLYPQEGEIIINGRTLKDETVWDIREYVGMVFQNPDNQFVGTTVQDDIAFGMENRGMPRDFMIKQIDKMLETVGMTEYRYTEPYRLSGGQKQRIAIASVLAIIPQLLILDEATSMLDPKGRKEIMNTVINLQEKQRLSLITITHHLEEIVHADRVLVMNEGRVWFEETPRQLFTKREELFTIGLDVPFISQLTESLKKYNITFERQPLSYEELLEDLWTLNSTM